MRTCLSTIEKYPALISYLLGASFLNLTMPVTLWQNWAEIVPAGANQISIVLGIGLAIIIANIIVIVHTLALETMLLMAEILVPFTHLSFSFVLFTALAFLLYNYASSVGYTARVIAFNQTLIQGISVRLSSIASTTSSQKLNHLIHIVWSRSQISKTEPMKLASFSNIPFLLFPLSCSLIE